MYVMDIVIGWIYWYLSVIPVVLCVCDEGRDWVRGGRWEIEGGGGRERQRKREERRRRTE